MKGFPEKLRLGTRGSALALRQSEWVQARLEGHHPGLQVQLVHIKTRGDRILDLPLRQVGGKGLFVKEIEEALLKGEIDLAVHSAKDVPAVIPEGLELVAFPVREDPRDVLISAGGEGLTGLPAGGKVGTSSLRRGAQILHRRPDLVIVPLRGNLDTRLRKLSSLGLAAVVVAAAGLRRMGWEGRVSEYLEPQVMLPGIGQGALALEARRGDEKAGRLTACLDDPRARAEVQAERAFLRRLEGDCQVPIAALAREQAGSLTLAGLVASLDGRELIKGEAAGPAAEGVLLGEGLAVDLLSRGGEKILEQARQGEK